MTRRSMPPSFHANLFALATARSYDPIRCQEPQWPRRPLAIGRRGLPLNPSRFAPGMSSTPSAQSHIRGYRSGGPQSSPSAGLPKSDYAHAAAAARPAKAGVSPKAARLAGTGAMSIRLPPGTSRRGPTATSRARRRWRRSPSPGACPWRASPRGAGAGARNPSSRASSPRAGRRCPWASASVGGSPGRSSRTPRRPAS